MKSILQLRDIHYSYGDKKVLKGVDFELYPGEIHALVGDHRTGKSTLIKLICGALRCRKGQIILPSGTFSFLTPKKALSEGVGVVFQEETLVPSLSAVDNIFSGRYKMYPIGVIRYKKHMDDLKIFCRTLDLDFDLNKPVSQLDKVHQHVLEFLRAIYFKPTILILDEISTRFTPREMDLIYKEVLLMKKQGLGIIYISHDMDEVMELADKVTILRDGKARKTEPIRNLDKMQLYYMTYSRELSRKELRQANLELYKFKKYNEAIIRNIPAGAVILDNELRIYQINEIASSLLQIHTDYDSTLSLILKKLSFDDSAAIKKALDNREKIQLTNVSYGKEGIYDFLCAPFSGDDGEAGGTIILIDDKTEALRIKEYMRRTEQISSIAELAAGVAHEINNPLNIILNYMDLLSLASLDDSSSGRLKKIEQEIQRITEITGSLLSFSKVRDTEFTNCDLKKAIQEALLLLKYRLEKSGVTLKLDIPDQEVILQGNLNKLEQVFINLILNSLEVLPPQGLIRISLVQEASKVTVRVQDNGPGIDDVHLPRIFDPFYTTKLEGKNSGLGLSVCLHIMNEHKGSIEYERRDGLTGFVLEFSL